MKTCKFLYSSVNKAKRTKRHFWKVDNIEFNKLIDAIYYASENGGAPVEIIK